MLTTLFVLMTLTSPQPQNTETTLWKQFEAAQEGIIPSSDPTYQHFGGFEKEGQAFVRVWSNGRESLAIRILMGKKVIGIRYRPADLSVIYSWEPDGGVTTLPFKNIVANLYTNDGK